MATTSRFLALSRTFFTKQTLTLISPSTSSSVSRLRPLAAALHRLPPPSPVFSGDVRRFSTRQSQSSLDDYSPNWSNRPPKETVLLDGCDFEHWLVVTEPPPEDANRDDIIDFYVKTLAQVVGSEDEARMKIYSVSTRCYYAFGAQVSEELSYKLKELPYVRFVLPDSYLDAKNKDYGGEPFINGKALPYDPKYHEEWIRNQQKAMERERLNGRRRYAARGGPPNGPPNIGDMPNQPCGPPNMGGMPNQLDGPPSGPPSGPLNMGGMPNQPCGPPNMGGMPNQSIGPPSGPPNMGGMPNQLGGPPSFPSSMGGMPNQPGGPPNMGGMPNQTSGPLNMGGMPNQPSGPPNMGGMPNQPGGQPNPGHGPNMAPTKPGLGQNGPHTNNPGYEQDAPHPDNPDCGQNVPHPNNPGYGQNIKPNNVYNYYYYYNCFYKYPK